MSCRSRPDTIVSAVGAVSDIVVKGRDAIQTRIAKRADAVMCFMMLSFQLRVIFGSQRAVYLAICSDDSSEAVKAVARELGLSVEEIRERLFKCGKIIVAGKHDSYTLDAKVFCRFFTFVTSQLPMSELNARAPKNVCSSVVTLP